MRRFVAICALCVVLPTTAIAQNTISWPDAVAPLTEARTKAEACVALLKKHGDAGQVSRGSLAYATAKAQMDSVIVGLVVALADGGKPDSLSVLQTKIEGGTSQLADFCDGIIKLLPPTPTGQKGEYTDLAKTVLDALVKPVSDGVAAIYNNYRGDKLLVRETIKTQLEAARWPDFAEVKAAQ